jgi:glycosyltransferase involved in cell wall biosynthesis
MTFNNKTKPKILVLIPNFLPGYRMGGPLTSVINLIENLNEDFYFEVLTSDRDMGDNKPFSNIQFNTWLIKRNYSVYYLSTNILMIFKLVSLIISSDADVIYLNSLFNPFFSISIILANKMGLLKAKKIILAPRGETFNEALNFKRFKKIFFIRIAKTLNLYKNIFWHASTEVEKKSIEKKLNIESQWIHVALNLAKKNSSNEIESIVSIPREDTNNLYVVFLSRVSKDKNIVFTLDVLKEIKANIVFHIFGPIEDDYIWKICEKKISALPKNIIVEYKGSVDKDDVKKVFAQYDLMFLPTFAENFGHVILESLSVGTPVLLSDNTPWRDLESKGYGWDLSLKNPELFINAIEYMSNLSLEEKKEMKLDIRKKVLFFLNNPETLNANKNLFKTLNSI